MTSVVGDAGITIAKNLDIAVTSGNSYTVFTALEGARQAAEFMGINLGRAEVAVVGADGLHRQRLRPDTGAGRRAA